MADTTFQNGVTLTDEDWFNDVNRLTYTIFGDASSLGAAQSRFFSATVAAAASLTNVNITGTLSVSAGAVLANVTVGGTLSVSAKATMAAVSLTDLSASSIAGAVVATQANMESAASTGSNSLVVTPSGFKFHPGSAKAWVRFDGTATSVTAGAAYNVTSITDNGTGSYTIILTTPFSSALWAPVVGANLNNWRLASVSANSVQIITLDLSGTAADAAIVTMVGFGDQ